MHTRRLLLCTFNLKAEWPPTAAAALQLPDPAVLAAMPRLRKLCLFIPTTDPPARQVKHALAGLAALPALDALCYCYDATAEEWEGAAQGSWRCWGRGRGRGRGRKGRHGEVEAGLAVLREAKPGLVISCSCALLECPDTSALFRFHAAH